MKDKFLQMAGVNSEEEFYSMFPTEEAFFQAYPEAREMKKGGNVPTNPGLYSRVKSEAKSKFDRWPSAYGSAWLVKTYKSRGGGYRKAQTGGGMEQQQIFQYPNYDGNMASYYNKMNEDRANNPMNAIGDFMVNGAMAAGTAMDNAEGDGQDKMQMAKLAMNVMGMPAMQMGGVGMMMRDNYYDEGGEMAMGQIMAMNDKISRLQNFINAQSEVEPWVASKLTLADDYISSVADYLQFNEGSEEGEEEEEDIDMNMGEMEEMKMGGIPQRYKNRGFTKVGAKRKSDRAGKKWMVLAKKGDKYKIVHGGYVGMKDFSQHGSQKRKKNFWNRMGGKDSSKATDPFSPLYWHKRFGTWANGGEPSNPGFQALPDYVQNKIMSNMAEGGTNNAGFQALPPYVQAKILSNMAYGGMTYPFMQDGGPALTEEQKAAAAEAAAKKKKRNETIAGIGLGVGTAAGVIASEIRAARKQRGYDKFMNSNDPRLGTGQYPSNKELRKMGRRMYGGDTDMYGGEMDMDAMYQMMKGGQPCYECGGKVYQEGGQQDQVMQAIQMYAQMTQTDPEQLMAQLQALPPLEQQEAIQKIMQAIQEAQAGQMKNGGIYINPANKGKFTESANRAGMGVQEFARKVLANKEDYSATQVKRANFARNSAGWKKQFGGMTEGAELELHPDEIQALIDQGYGIEYLD
jgi:hypothetical protein